MTYRSIEIEAGIAGKCALVTGSTQGMGWAIARALASQGCHVMLNGLANPEDVQDKIRILRDDYGAKVSFSGADLAEYEQVKAMVRQAEEELGPIEILVNNAATRNAAKIEDIPKERWDNALAVNLSAPFHLIQFTLPGMKERQWGRIINIASNLGLTAIPNRSDYVANKHGLVGLTRAVAVEALPYKVTANAICPGSTLTPHAERQINERMAQGKKSREEAVKDFLETKQPSRRFVDPAQIGDLVLFLCSDAASEITGTPISIDGGWMASA
ncbi:MAG TPA: 3-hydroxybutyrate dehydrogenase [Hyphomicrobiaceae bacterium]